MEYLSLSRRRERVGISSHWGNVNGSRKRLRKLEWNADKKNVKVFYIASLRGSNVTLQYIRARERAWKSRL